MSDHTFEAFHQLVRLWRKRVGTIIPTIDLPGTRITECADELEALIDQIEKEQIPQVNEAGESAASRGSTSDT
jgi:hypothetical protein